jgi:hypothetical protein
MIRFSPEDSAHRCSCKKICKGCGAQLQISFTYRYTNRELRSGAIHPYLYMSPSVTPSFHASFPGIINYLPLLEMALLEMGLLGLALRFLPPSFIWCYTFGTFGDVASHLPHPAWKREGK